MLGPIRNNIIQLADQENNRSWYAWPVYYFSNLNPEDYWKVSLTLALFLHIMTFAATLIPPSIFSRDIPFTEYSTVDLFNVVEEAPAPIVPVQITPEKIKTKISTPINTPPLVKDQVSLNPLRSKLKKEQAEKEKLQHKQLVDDALRKKLEALKFNIAEQRANDQARDAAKNAVDKLKDLYGQINASSKPTNPDIRPADRPPQASGELSQLQKIYWANVAQHIQSFWSLPDLQNWDEQLTAVMVIIVRRNGTLIKKYFEKKSNNFYFNQFVEKTLLESLPLPAFPPDLKENEIEIGLVFHPAGLI